MNAADYVVWRNTNGDTVAPGQAADANFDGHVNQLDYGIWRSHFGESSPSTGSMVGVALPEPSTLACTICCFCLSLSISRSRCLTTPRRMRTLQSAKHRVQELEKSFHRDILQELRC